VRNASGIEVDQQPRLLRQKFDDRRRREILGRITSLGGWLGPHEREFDVGVGPLRGGQDFQHGAQGGALTVRIVRLAQRPAQRITEKNGRSFQDVPELTNIARPVVVEQGLSRRPGNAGWRSTD
jgi:hypothetical protein